MLSIGLAGSSPVWCRCAFIRTGGLLKTMVRLFATDCQAIIHEWQILRLAFCLFPYRIVVTIFPPLILFNDCGYNGVLPFRDSLPEEMDE